MKILVIGGAGHVGSNLLEYLKNSNKNYDLTSLDNYSNGSEKNHIDGVRYIVGDARYVATLVDNNFDVIVHLGEFARIEQSFKKYKNVVDNNIIGTLSVIDFCIQNSIKLVYSASSAISSMGEVGLTNAPYTISKSHNVNLINSLSRHYQLNYAIVYFYNVFGPREVGFGETATVVEKFLQLKFEKKKAFITPPGTQRRNFTDVRDIVDGIQRVIHNGNGDGYFIGNPQSFSIIELAEMIGVEYEMGSNALGNRRGSSIELSKLTELGWKPKYDLKTYIQSRLRDGK